MRTLVRVRLGATRWGVCALASLALAACGGGGGASSTSSTGGGGGGGGGGTPTTFSVGGTVTGLSASGLVLQDNGGDNLTVPSGASTFTFSTMLASGASYDVTVLSQPTGETCTVSSATGTVSADVTTVKVSCSAQTFTISGTLTGLSTAGLKLQDYSGGEVLPVAAGATTFQFTQSVPYGTNVDVTVNTQPFWATCTAGSSNFSGSIASNESSESFSCTADTATVSTFAGSLTAGSTDATGTSASFYHPDGTAVDSSGNIYVADEFNDQIREISSSGVVTTLAGQAGVAGSTNGAGTLALFDHPQGVAVDSSGNLYVADTLNNEIRKIVCTGTTASTCVVSTLAGSTTAGSTDGTGSAASFSHPEGVAVDSLGNVYVADSANNEIRKISPAGLVTTLAGTTVAGSANGSGTSASFNYPTGVAVDSAGNVYVADANNNEIRMIDTSDVVSTLAGSTTAGSADGTGSSASFFTPLGVAVDSAGNVYVADTNNEEIRLVTPKGVVTTLAGQAGVVGHADGTGTSATFDSPSGIAVDASGDLFVGDYSNNEIRKITP